MSPNTPAFLKNWKRKITRIDAMMLVDCVPNPFALIAGTAVGFFHVWWSVAGPECIDSAWDRVKAGQPGPIPPGAPGAQRKHRRFLNRGTATGPVISPSPGNPGGTMVPLGNLAQHLGFGLAIIDGLLDGVFYGASLARRYSGCATPFRPYAQMSLTNATIALFPAATFFIGQWQLVGRHILLTDSTQILFPPGVENFTTVQCNLKQKKNAIPGLPDATFSWKLKWLQDGSYMRQNWGGLGWNPTGDGVLAGQDVIRPGGAAGGQVVVEVTKSDGVLIIETGSFMAFAGNYVAPLSFYSCGAKAETGKGP